MSVKINSIFYESAGRIRISIDVEEYVCAVRPCFPISNPTKNLSVRNYDGEEILFVEEIDTLKPSWQGAIYRALKEANFLQEIVGIENISEKFELRIWKVILLGNHLHTITTNINDWPNLLQSGSVVITDVYGDHYLIRDPLRIEGYQKLEPFVD